MDRNREARRVTMAATNGLSRRRHRSNSLRDSPEDDEPLELHDTTSRLRDRGTGKKDRDRDRHREKDRDRDRMSSRSKRRRGERIHGTNREDGGGDDSSEESVEDDEDDEDDEGGGGGSGTSVRMLPPNPSPMSSSSLPNHHHRKSFPPSAKVFRATPTAAVAAAPWRATDEMIGVSVPRKARSASTKRSHECWVSSGGVGAEQIHRQASTSPARSSGPAVLASASASSAPVSPPSSSNASVKKKMKPNGPKQRPPSKSTLKTTTSSGQDEIEIEIAEVLYGMLRQPQGPTKQEIMPIDVSMEVNNHNKSSVDAKSSVSSPISSSPSAAPHSSTIPISNSSYSAVAPKRKRPRPVKYEEENPSDYPVRNIVISSITKPDADQASKIEICSPNLENSSGQTAIESNGGVTYGLLSNQAATVASSPEPAKPETNLSTDSKASSQELEGRDCGVAKEEPRLPKEESPPGLKLEDDPKSLTTGKANTTISEVEIQGEQKFQIDLMALPPPPPPLRSSPERDSEINFVSVDPKAMVTDVEPEMKPMVKEDEKAGKMGNKEDMNVVEPEVKKAKVTAGEEVESQNPIINKERKNIDLQLDLEKTDRDTAPITVGGNKLHHHHHVQKQQQQPPTSEKNAQPTSMPLPMSMPSWPGAGGLPPMGYMAPLQGVVCMDGTAVSPAGIQPPHLLFTQPRPKRCATHWYIARNIHYHQQFTRMNPFWPAAAGSALQYGAKACSVNVVPSTDLQAGRVVNSVQDKGQGLSIFPGHTGKDKAFQAPNIVDTAQRKQILLQQAIPPGTPNSILHGPAFIFPWSQQQAATAASVRTGNIKSPAAGAIASSSTSGSASSSATAAAVAGATAMNFNYPNLHGNETQYLAVLQNGAYPIPIPAHVGNTPAYRGPHPPGMPFFNGSFYSSQMLHPSQLQQQQPSATLSPQSQQGHQNPSISSGSSSSKKHLHSQQPRPHGNAMNGSSSGNLQSFPGPKNLPSQSLQLQQRQQTQNHNAPHQARQLERELGGEDSHSTADSRVSRANMNIYGQNFTMQMHPPNFALMTPSPVGGANNTSGNSNEKKQQQPQHQGTKPGVEPLPTFAMSFASISGSTTGPGFDISSISQNHALLQSFPEAARHGYHFMTAGAVGQAAQQKTNFRVPEEGKAGGNDGSNADDERRAVTGGKASVSGGHSIAFSRPDLTDASVSTMQGNTVIDTSARPLNLGSAAGRVSNAVGSTTMTTTNAASTQQQQMMQLQKQHQFPAAAAATASARSKTPATSNGTVYLDHISTSSIPTKFPNPMSAFPQNFVQGSSSAAQSPQWKSSVRTPTSQVSSPSSASNSSSLKNLSLPQGRTQPVHTHISFAANPKSSAASQVQQPPNSSQSLSSSMVVGSPKSFSTSTSNKGGQSSTLTSQQAKNSPSVPVQKSSPVGGRNITSILGSHSHNATSSSSSGIKSQLPQQQHLQKHAMQPHILSNSAYMQAQAQHASSSGNNLSAAGGYYLQRHRSDQQQQPQSSFATSSTLSICPPVTLANSGTTDPAKAVAAAAAVAASNIKGVSLPSAGLIPAQFATAQSSGKQHQRVPPGFSFAHAVPSAVKVKPAEQKQPAGE